jgi:S-methylmethionine-dependent homocysteine/selenocysteine methylase
MDFTLLDGGMGQELIARSTKPPTALWATQVLLESPELVKAVHADYFKAGADIATTNTYAVHHDRLEPYNLDDKFAQLHHLACRLAVQARDEHGKGQVAGSLGPLGWSYRPEMAFPFDQAAERYAEIVKLQEPYVDFFLCETMSSLEQARAAVVGAKTVGKPVWLSVSVKDEKGTELRSGENVSDIIKLVKELEIDTVLINCSTPEAVSQALPNLANPGLRLGAYANGFSKIPDSYKTKGSTVDALETRQDLSPEVYANFAMGWLSLGATIIGGCCEVGPAHIREIALRLQ